METNPKTRAFAYWILGYQGFYEPVVRAWFEDHGLSSVAERSIKGHELIPSGERLATSGTFPCLPEPLRSWGIKELTRKCQTTGGRVQLDLLLRSPDGLISGECKSWGGFSGPVTWKDVDRYFVSGRDGLFLLLSVVRGEPVAESYLVLWSRSDEHTQIEVRLSEIFERPVRLFYIDEILASPGPLARIAIEDRLAFLDGSVALVKKLLGKEAE